MPKKTSSKTIKKPKSSINKKRKTIKKGKTKRKTKTKTIKKKSSIKPVLILTPEKRQIDLDQFKYLSPYRVNPLQRSPPLLTNPMYNVIVDPIHRIETTTPQAIEKLNTDSPGTFVPLPEEASPRLVREIVSTNLHPELHPLEIGRRNRGRRFHTDSDNTLRRILFQDDKIGGKKPHPKKVGGKLKFEDHPEFRPNLTPRQIFTMGSFGGTYFRPIKSNFYNNTLRNKHKKFSFLKGIPENKLTRPFNKYDVKLNKYGKKVGTTLEFWEGKNWINKQDPYGWMQWYCEFYDGRRSSDDKRQISRWLKITGPKGRFRKFLVTEILKKGTKKDYKNDKISPKIRQTLQHWGYKLTKKDFDDEIKSRK